MNDVTSIKAPGWQRIVAELSSGAPDDRVFLDRLLRTLSQVAAARQAVLFGPGTGGSGELKAVPLAAFPLPPAPAGAPSDMPDPALIQQTKDCHQAAYAALESGQSRIFTLETTSSAMLGPTGGEPATTYVVAIALPSGSNGSANAGDGPGIPGAITLLIDARSRAAVQSTVAMAEVIAGYVHVHGLRQELKRLTASGRSLELATRLIGAINTASGFKGACIQTVNDLAKLISADRVAIGWATPGSSRSIEVRAMSDTEHFDKRTVMVQRMASAMDECLDQEQPVMHPPPSSEQDVALSTAIAHAHRELAAGDTQLAIASVPLRHGDTVVGVLTVEAKPRETGMGGMVPGIDPTAVELLQATMDLVTPVLSIRKSDDRNLALRAWGDTIKAGSWLVGTKHTVWKLGGLAVIGAMLFVTFFSITYRVGATGELKAREKRIISVPFEGVLKSRPAGIEAGVVVKAGTLLAQMDTTELLFQAEEAKAKLVQADRAMAQAMKESKAAEAKRAEAQGDQARAQLDLVNSRIARSSIVAPIDGTLIAGELRERIGAAVKLGDELYAIAPLDTMMAVAKVDERDIALISVGTKGELATRSVPGKRFGVTVEQIVPLATSEEGKNQFEVRVRLDEAAGWMRPGMEGIIRLDSGEHSLLYIGTRRIVDIARLWIW